jgi:hypothetical protein
MTWPSYQFLLSLHVVRVQHILPPLHECTSLLNSARIGVGVLGRFQDIFTLATALQTYNSEFTFQKFDL